ncbi:hypothetical protein GTR04_0984 [Trichophyton interdigitale]|uniref:Uncharacterized protein n=1 Tax=Trichophyton interdigitale TaxID=101480 RepID=A0A9P4YHZ0_9EURO|nr:hypothetical protein GY631_3363 [Trichophyton interdigitale]KAF3898148.1 hypothetical protein GY632_1917 [Trichophyton interdigitale]KAG8211662.1 hypothetical protein GTR04_0984 [Trichophyton interdigitale]
MALRLFPRGRTAYYNICIDGYRIPGSLDYATVIHHIPHLRDCPRRPATSQSALGRLTVDIDLTAAVRRCRLVDSLYFPLSRFRECLDLLVRVLRDHQRHPQHDPGSTLCENLDQTLLHSRYDWAKVLEYFACFAYLFDDAVLKASTSLHRGMSSFIARNRREMALHAPLNVSLQFVDLCFHEDFITLMTALFEQLRSSDRAYLVRYRGMIPLFLDGRPSLQIPLYFEDRYGDRGGVRDRIKIRARRRVRRRHPGLLERGLFIHSH